jgi:hypothetical protein
LRAQLVDEIGPVGLRLFALRDDLVHDRTFRKGHCMARSRAGEVDMRKSAQHACNASFAIQAAEEKRKAAAQAGATAYDSRVTPYLTAQGDAA